MKVKFYLLFLIIMALISCKNKNSHSTLQNNDFVLAQYGEYKITYTEFKNLIYAYDSLKEYLYMNHENMDNFLKDSLMSKALYDKILPEIKDVPEYKKRIKSFQLYRDFQMRNFVIQYFVENNIMQQAGDKVLKKYFNDNLHKFVRISFNQIVLLYKNKKEYQFKLTAAKTIVKMLKNGDTFLPLYTKYNEDSKNNGSYNNVSPFDFPYLKNLSLKSGEIYTINDNGKIRIIIVNDYTTFNDVKKQVIKKYYLENYKNKKGEIEEELLKNYKFQSFSKRLFLHKKEIYPQKLWQKK